MATSNKKDKYEELYTRVLTDTGEKLTREELEEMQKLIDEEEATLKRFRKKGDTIALEAANDNFETRIYSGNQVNIQGILAGLIRSYN